MYKLDPDESLFNLKIVKDGTKGFSVNAYTGTKDGYFVLYPATDIAGGRNVLCDCMQYDPRYRWDFLEQFLKFL